MLSFWRPKQEPLCKLRHRHTRDVPDSSLLCVAPRWQGQLVVLISLLLVELIVNLGRALIGLSWVRFRGSFVRLPLLFCSLLRSSFSRCARHRPAVPTIKQYVLCACVRSGLSHQLGDYGCIVTARCWNRFRPRHAIFLPLRSTTAPGNNKMPCSPVSILRRAANLFLTELMKGLLH